MKRVLADHNVPRPLVRLLTAFEIKTAAKCGWDTLHDSELLTAAEQAGFEVLLTGDKTLPHENAIAGRKIGAAANLAIRSASTGATGAPRLCKASTTRRRLAN